MQQAIQKERVGGFKDFIADVQSGGFPAKAHIIEAPDGLMATFLDEIEKGR